MSCNSGGPLAFKAKTTLVIWKFLLTAGCQNHSVFFFLLLDVLNAEDVMFWCGRLRVIQVFDTQRLTNKKEQVMLLSLLWTL